LEQILFRAKALVIESRNYVRAEQVAGKLVVDGWLRRKASLSA
jgi:hypothetical protein